MRVALEDAPVHERTGIALVGVADDVLARASRLRHRVPLEARRVAGTAAAAQAALGDLIAHLGWRHRREDMPERRVAAGRDIVVKALRIDSPRVLGRDPDLAGEERGLSYAIGASRHRSEGLDDRSEGVWPDLAEELAGLGDLDERPRGAEPQAADPLDRDVGHVAARNLLAKPDEDVVRRGRQAAYGFTDVR